MSSQSQFTQLIEDLETNYHLEFPTDQDSADAGRLRALRETRERNLQLMQDHFDEIIMLIQHKRPFIEALEQMTEELDREIAALEPPEPSVFRKGKPA